MPFIKTYGSLLVAILCLFAFAGTSAAQTKIPDAQIKAYYEGCNKATDSRMVGALQEKFCSCTAIKMQESLTLEDVAAMQTPSAEQRPAYNKFLLKVYGGCMEYPIRGLIQTSCEQNPETKTNPKLCNCVADNMAAYARDSGQSDLRRILVESPDIQDPATALTQSRAYKKAEQETALKCAKAALQR